MELTGRLIEIIVLEEDVEIPENNMMVLVSAGASTTTKGEFVEKTEIHTHLRVRLSAKEWKSDSEVPVREDASAQDQ